MDINKITVAYFSPTGNVEKVARRIAEKASESLGADVHHFDFLSPASRKGGLTSASEQTGELRLGKGELLIIGVPVYAGRVPNRILPFIRSGFKANEKPGHARKTEQGCQPLCIPVVCFGNRSFGDALSELAMEMRHNGFIVPAGAAIASEHSFCREIGTGRPDEQDMSEIDGFATGISCTIRDCMCEMHEPAMPGNTPPGPYYQPLKEDGTPADFLKTAFPITDERTCNKCMKCAMRCPMGSIDKNDPAVITGICIKCQACIACCETGAKCFADEDFISHKRMLAANYNERAQSVFVHPR